LPVSVVVPTSGRVERLRACLESLSRCVPRAEEVVVVDQSGDPRVAEAVERFRAAGARLVRSGGFGVSAGVNRGLASARRSTVLVTHDDCTVAPSWVETAHELAAEDSEAIVTGRVLPFGDSRAVPSVKDDPRPYDYTGEVRCGVLYPNNMVLDRAATLAFGAFDERFRAAAEDNDLCYRWLRSGRRLRYAPELVVWHHDWRTHDELEALYARYWRAQGHFYAKHLRRGDFNMLRFIALDLYAATRAAAAAVAHGRPRWSDPRRGVLRGLLPGLVEGWSLFADSPESATGESTSGTALDGPHSD
jgi:GT2 family glycosyltransferase